MPVHISSSPLVKSVVFSLIIVAGYKLCYFKMQLKVGVRCIEEITIVAVYSRAEVRLILYAGADALLKL